MSNTSQKNLFEAFTLGTIKLGRRRTCVNKNVTKSKVENHHYKTAAPSEINTRQGVAEEPKNPKELLNEENSNSGHEPKYR